MRGDDGYAAGSSGRVDEGAHTPIAASRLDPRIRGDDGYAAGIWSIASVITVSTP
jgi:hypothetical protein